MAPIASPRLSERIAETLYREALRLADATRAYFDGPGLEQRATLRPKARAQFSNEALKATVRLTQIISWLTMRRMAGPSADRPGDVRSDRRAVAALPADAQPIILAGIELYERAGRLAAGSEGPIVPFDPARTSPAWLERVS